MWFKSTHQAFDLWPHQFLQFQMLDLYRLCIYWQWIPNNEFHVKIQQSPMQFDDPIHPLKPLINHWKMLNRCHLHRSIPDRMKTMRLSIVNWKQFRFYVIRYVEHLNKRNNKSKNRITESRQFKIFRLWLTLCRLQANHFGIFALTKTVERFYPCIIHGIEVQTVYRANSFFSAIHFLFVLQMKQRWKNLRLWEFHWKYDQSRMFKIRIRMWVRIREQLDLQ